MTTLANRIVLATLAVQVLLPTYVLADKCTDGNYRYSDTVRSKVTATVSNGGALLTIDPDEMHLYNPVTDNYERIPVPPGGNSIHWTDQGYRYLGVNIGTGVCTLYRS